LVFFAANHRRVVRCKYVGDARSAWGTTFGETPSSGALAELVAVVARYGNQASKCVLAEKLWNLTVGGEAKEFSELLEVGHL
jgi:hypothetical protein